MNEGRSPLIMRSELSILLGILTCLVLFACRPSHIHREDKSAVYVKSVEGVPIGKWMPETSEDIEYFIEDSGFGHSAQWKCRVSETDFLAFCREKGYSPLPKRPENENFLFRYYGSFDMPEKYYYVLKPTASSAALRLLYDRDMHFLYGSYADR